jgi:hypothetical protein
MIKTQSKTEIISKVLSPALKLWLKSQLDHVEDLEIKINGGDTQILRGKIDSVTLSTTKAVYQGIHVGEVQLKGENIAVNLGGVLRGKPLRLLEPIFVTGELLVPENYLTASLSSPLLSQGLTDLLVMLLENQGIENPTEILANYQIHWQNLTLNSDKFILTGLIIDSHGNSNTIILISGLELDNSQTLLFNPLVVEGIPILNNLSINQFKIDLGSDVELHKLNLSDRALSCGAKVKIVS